MIIKSKVLLLMLGFVNLCFTQTVITKLSINDYDRIYSVVLQSNDSITGLMNPCHLSPDYVELSVDSTLLAEIKDFFVFYKSNVMCMRYDPDNVFVGGGSIFERMNVERDSIKKNKVRLYFINTAEDVLYYKVIRKKRFYRKLKKLLNEGEEKKLFKKIIYKYKKNELKKSF